MINNTSKNHQIRMEAFDEMLKLKKLGANRVIIINKLCSRYKIPKGTLYDWYSDKMAPYGRRGKIFWCRELFYVLGALLGDGCIYHWKNTYYYTILVGDERFTKKYAKLLSKCVGKKVKAYIDRSKNIWFVRHNNYALFSLFDNLRKNPHELENMILKKGVNAAQSFIEGYFDAEGCVKIIKEKVRITPKICLDITNTNKGHLDIMQRLLISYFRIDARYSIQKPRKGKYGSLGKIAYHLRIYKKEYVKIFFQNFSTTKLTLDKRRIVTNWLERKNKRFIEGHFDNSFQLVTN